MKKLLLGLLVTLPIAFATQASALPGGVQDSRTLNPAVTSGLLEIKGGHGGGRGHGMGRGGGHRAAYGWSQGRKVGWRGRGCPPGLYKQGRC